MLVKKLKRILNIKVLPGEPTDGTGKVCIHLFVIDEKGSFTEPCVAYYSKDEQGTPIKTVKATRGRVACDIKKIPTLPKNNVSTILMRTDEPRAVTCLKCKDTNEYKSMMSRYEESK